MIKLENIHKSFGPKRVLQGFSLEIKEGETMVVIGYSGTGKSVAIKHIVGLLEPDHGTVFEIRVAKTGAVVKVSHGAVVVGSPNRQKNAVVLGSSQRHHRK